MAVAGKAAITLDGAWSSTKEYDRLTGVTHNNCLYISRKKPPIGTAPSEGEYWMLCIEGVNEADFDALAQELRAGYYPNTGGTLTGDVTLQKADNGYSQIFKNHSASADYGTEVADVASDGRKARLVLNASSGLAPQFYDKDGNGGSFYGVFNKPTANDVGALPLTGGTITGKTIWMNNKYGLVECVGKETITIACYDSAENTQNGRIFTVFTRSRMEDVKDCIVLRSRVNNSSTNYTIYGGHNKPFGSYTGNGSASERTIDTKSIGRLLLVYKEGSDVFALVSPQGALVKNLGEADGTQAHSAYYVNGEFYIATTSDYFNTSGATYYYQVI